MRSSDAGRVLTTDNGLFQIHKFGWGKRERSTLHVFRRSIHFFNFNVYELMVRKLGLTGTLRWGLRCTGMETIIPGLIGADHTNATMCGIVGSSIGGHKWKAMEAFKARETMRVGAGQGELQAADASLRVPLRIICIPFFNWLCKRSRCLSVFFRVSETLRRRRQGLREGHAGACAYRARRVAVRLIDGAHARAVSPRHRGRDLALRSLPG